MVSTPDPAWFVAELPISSRAAAWASEAHAGQERDVDGAPFVVHALEVALHLHVLGCRDDVVAAAILHDIVEKIARLARGRRGVVRPDARRDD